MKKYSGFTLVELMVSIAIIGILAIVLLPKAAVLKQEAKITGVCPNMRTAVAIAETLLEQYNTNTINQVEDALSAELYTNNTDVDIRNPVTGATGCINFGETEVNNNAAFAYFKDIDETGDSRYEEIGQSEDFAGIILYDVYLDSQNNLRIKFIPFDYQGRPMTKIVMEAVK